VLFKSEYLQNLRQEQPGFSEMEKAQLKRFESEELHIVVR
jgi:hypothetical protein